MISYSFFYIYKHKVENKMESQYTWLTIGKSFENRVIDIMGAPVTEPSVFLEEISKMMGAGTILCIGGELKTSEEGKPASNFRYEKDPELNSNVIENYIQLFQLHESIFHSKPIFVTTIPRSWRKYVVNPRRWYDCKKRSRIQERIF